MCFSVLRYELGILLYGSHLLEMSKDEYKIDYLIKAIHQFVYKTTVSLIKIHMISWTI